MQDAYGRMVKRRRECLNPQCLDSNGARYRFTSHERLSPQAAAELAELDGVATNPPNRENLGVPRRHPTSTTAGPSGLSAKQAGVSPRRSK